MNETKSEVLVKERQLVIPGDTLATGLDFLPSSGSFRANNEIKSKILGLAKVKDRFVGAIPLSGVYAPKVGDGIIGFITDMQTTIWIADINSPYDAILPLSEAVGEYVDLNKTDISVYYDIGDIVYAKVLNISKSKRIQLTMNDHRARKLIGGRIMRITPSKVPRVIGKSGSMIELIKEKTKCQIIVGQNGVIWVKGENEVLAADTILKIEKESHVSGLTDKISKFLEKGD
ncbi:MAG: RNA-binding protein [Candidatus Aenigmarchaeota archaeon]|nr:RNA-binding protein [Candidatus Aenigmarchaeota archaeon]